MCNGVVKRSAGILLYRRASPLEVLLVHPGGPWFAYKDEWGLPKGEYGHSEEPMAAAYREFEEETGFPAPTGDPLTLGEVTLKSGKVVVAWALEGDLDAQEVVSNTFTMYHRGRLEKFPEIDEARWFTVKEARKRIAPRQAPFLDRLVEALA